MATYAIDNNSLDSDLVKAGISRFQVTFTSGETNSVKQWYEVQSLDLDAIKEALEAAAAGWEAQLGVEAANVAAAPDLSAI